jgi:hypothetical protein
MVHAFQEMETISGDALTAPNSFLELDNAFLEMDTTERNVCQMRHPCPEKEIATLKRKPSVELSTPISSIQPPIHLPPYFFSRNTLSSLSPLADGNMDGPLHQFAR